jgi:ATP-binding cassette, subfamily B, bacterial PglK
MLLSCKSFYHLARRAFSITAPFGRRRLALVFSLIGLQALLQVVGVSSIYPFLAFAADPTAARSSAVGRRVTELFPNLSDGQLLLWAGVAAIVLLFVSNLANLASEVARMRYGAGFGSWLKVRLLERMARREYAYFLQRNTAELLKKVIHDVPHYVNGVLLPLLEVLARAVTTVMLVTALIIISPGVALGATAVFGCFYGLAFRALSGLRRRISTGLKTASRGVSREANQLLGSVKTVKMHQVEAHFLDRFAKHSRIQARLAAWIPVLGNGTRYLIEPVAFGGLVVVVLLMSRQQQSFTQLIPMIGVMALAGYRLLPAVQALYSQLNNISTNRYAMEEITEEFAELDPAASGRPAGLNVQVVENALPLLSRAIEVQNLTFQYPAAEKPVLQGLSFSIPANSSFAITGRTGSGKSTLVDLLLGLHMPTRGDILVDGVALGEGNLSSWRRQVGYVPQDIYLLDDTIARNIAFGLPPAHIDRERLRDAARRAQILDFIESELPEGFESKVGERGVRISGGQRQRIGLARALYLRPNVLVLDEATSALDAETENALVDALEELHGNLTMIVVAHRLSTIERCDYRLHLVPDQKPELTGV